MKLKWCILYSFILAASYFGWSYFGWKILGKRFDVIDLCLVWGMTGGLLFGGVIISLIAKIIESRKNDEHNSDG